MTVICSECGGRLAAPDEVNYLVCMQCGEKYDYGFVDEIPDHNTQLLVVLDMQTFGSAFEIAMADAFIRADPENREKLWRFMPVFQKFLEKTECRKKGKKSQIFPHPVTGTQKPLKDGEFCDLVKNSQENQKGKRE